MILTPSPMADAPVFSAEIRPHRSLGPQGFRVLMVLLCAASIIVSLPFVILGSGLSWDFSVSTSSVSTSPSR